RFRIEAGEAVPLAASRHAAFPGIGRMGRIKNRMRQGLREEGRETDEIVAVRAVAVQQHDGRGRRLTGGGDAGRALKCIDIRHHDLELSLGCKTALCSTKCRNMTPSCLPMRRSMPPSRRTTQTPWRASG